MSFSRNRPFWDRLYLSDQTGEAAADLESAIENLGPIYTELHRSLHYNEVLDFVYHNRGRYWLYDGSKKVPLALQRALQPHATKYGWYNLPPRGRPGRLDEWWLFNDPRLSKR